MQRSNTVPDISFIVPCYNEAESVLAFHREFKRVFDQSGLSWELVYVDDGSTDATYALLKEIHEQAPNTALVRFSRNFGKDAAVHAGLQHAKGNLVGIIDADLQQQPSTALDMANALMADDELDCVAAYQQNRRDSAFMNACGHWFYRVLAGTSNMDVVPDASDFRVFRRVVRDAILSLPEGTRFSKGIFSWIGFNTLPWPYTPDHREAGTSKWCFRKLVSYAADGILSFTIAPLRTAIWIGSIVAALAVVYFLVILIQTLAFGVDVPGYATTIGVVLLLGGMQLFMMGVLGEYLGRTFMETKQRPVYIAKEVLDSQCSGDSDS